MPVKRRHSKRRGGKAFSLAGYWELLYGPLPEEEGRGVFQTREEMHEAWEVRRDEIMATEFLPGFRPFCFWEFDYDGDWPDDVPMSRMEEIVYLQKLGNAEELAGIEERWRWNIECVLDRHSGTEAREIAIDVMNVPPWFFDQHQSAQAA
jgi:hypothetical protein